MSVASFVDLKLLNKRDFQGFRLCRWCGKRVEGRRKFYCSDKCYNAVYHRYWWDWVRRDVLRRDNHTCQWKKLGLPNGDVEDKCIWKFETIKQKQEVHHIVPISILVIIIRQCWELGIYGDMSYELAIMNAITIKSNLLTLCTFHHGIAHRLINEGLKAYEYDAQTIRDLEEFERKYRTLDDFINHAF